MATSKQVVGKRGEDLACDYYLGLGFKIIDRNYWRPWGEIDVIAQRGRELRFIEVKTVTRATLSPAELDYEPEDNIHPWKRERLRRIIQTYLLQKDIPDEIDWQVDALSIYLNPQLELLKVEALEDLVI